MTSILHPLIKANAALLSQKIALLDVLVAKHGANYASEAFQKTCPVVGASIGQHYRHSMDHIELAALVARSTRSTSSQPGELHYDLRVRGGTLESDILESRKRIVNVVDVIESLHSLEADEELPSTSVGAYFNLTADFNDEIGLPSTVGRELGFAVHHGIHHMAMVKIIALQTLGMNESDLPLGFGRAPSTIIFDKQQE